MVSKLVAWMGSKKVDWMVSELGAPKAVWWDFYSAAKWDDNLAASWAESLVDS